MMDTSNPTSQLLVAWSQSYSEITAEAKNGYISVLLLYPNAIMDIGR